MVHHSYPITSAKLANGELVIRNDHIYVSPPWSDRDGTPYMIARIIEFLPPNATPRKGARQASSNEMQVRISLYYRPSDISGRNVSDFRLLLAAIHTDVQPLSHIRGKCYVRHKDRIEDLLAWKKMPDRFYFVRFFDPYIKREFDVIRTEAVNNIPQNVKETLMNRYEYLVTEREMVSDLTDNYRSCCVCTEWASSQDSIRCESCKNIYHMHCLNPPLLAKPAKGYSWFCLSCSMQRHKDVQAKKFHFGGSSAVPGSAGGKGGKAGGAGQKKEKSVTGSRGDVCYKGWPWRYFGQYTRAQDTLDSDDPIFPRAATRVGQKFQANVPSWEEQQAAAEARQNPGESMEAGPSRHIAVERGHDIGERKNESTIAIMCLPIPEVTSYMQEVAALRLPVSPYDTERLNMAVISYFTLGREGALQYMRDLRFEDFKPIVFSDKETSVFEAELERTGGLDTHTTAKLIRRTPAEVLRFSYIWKNRKLKAENDALRAHTKITAHGRKGQALGHTQSQTLGAPSLGRIRARDDGDDSDGEGSMFAEEPSGKLQCAACSTRTSRVWWRCPRSVQGNAMCENCGTNYRKYGVISFAKAEDSKRVPEKKDALVTTKKGKGDTASGASTPVPVPPPKLPPCACCRRMEPKSAMARCKTCTFSAHAGCYGIASQDMGPDWECELCLNAKQEDNHLEPRCLLCPRDTSSLTTKIKTKKAPADFDLLSAMKPTEGRRWAHILCSAWIPETIYTNPATMKSIEGIVNLPLDRWTTACSLCNQLDGAVIHCADCDTPFHASCAYQSGYKFGFEFSLAKPGKKEVVTIAKFKDGMGVMNPGCWCRGHDLEGRTIYEMHEIDPEQNETALQVYASSYKSLPLHDDTFALLRKARRLDLALTSTPKATEEKSCGSCGIDVSPIWHTKSVAVKLEEDMMDIDGEDHRKEVLREGRVCHLCFHKPEMV